MADNVTLTQANFTLRTEEGLEIGPNSVVEYELTGTELRLYLNVPFLQVSIAQCPVEYSVESGIAGLATFDASSLAVVLFAATGELGDQLTEVTLSGWVVGSEKVN